MDRGAVTARQCEPIPKSVTAKKPRKGLKPQRGTSTAALKRKAVKLHSEYVRARDGACVRCGGTYRLQCAHMVRRTYAATVTDEMNARALCGGCHIFIDSHHWEAVKFWSEQFGVAHYEATRNKAYAGKGKVMLDEFWKGEIERLEAGLKALRG